MDSLRVLALPEGVQRMRVRANDKVLSYNYLEDIR